MDWVTKITVFFCFVLSQCCVQMQIDIGHYVSIIFSDKDWILICKNFSDIDQEQKINICFHSRLLSRHYVAVGYDRH